MNPDNLTPVPDPTEPPAKIEPVHPMTAAGHTFYGRGEGVYVRMSTLPGQRAINLSVDNEERVDELLEIMQRAMNTWENPPVWAIEIMDKFTGMPAPTKRPTR